MYIILKNLKSERIQQFDNKAELLEFAQKQIEKKGVIENKTEEKITKGSEKISVMEICDTLSGTYKRLNIPRGIEHGKPIFYKNF